MRDVRIMVTGSRDWSDEETIRRALLEWKAPKWKPTIIHGRCRGADEIADRLAREMGFEVVPYKADWDRHGRAAGPLRNQQMFDSGPDVVLAFPLAYSKGTWSVVRLARKLGVEVRVFEPWLWRNEEP